MGAPKYLTKHEAVLRVEPGEDQGSDYRWFVELKPGWVFNSGRAEGCNTPMLFVDNRDDFVRARPEYKGGAA